MFPFFLTGDPKTPAAKYATTAAAMMFLIVFLCAHWPSLFAITIVKPNVGVIFNQRQDIKVPTFYWHHTIGIPVNFPVKPDNEPQSLCRNANNTLCSAVLDMQLLYDGIQTRIYDHLNLSLSEIYHMMTSPDTVRDKRGLIDIIGKGAKSLFGLATEEDIKILQHHVVKLHSLMKDKDNAQRNDIKSLHSIQIQSSKRMDNLANHLQNVDDVILNMSGQFQILNKFIESQLHGHIPRRLRQHEHLFDDIAHVLQWNAHISMKLTSLLETYNILQSMTHDIPHLLNGKLTPNLVLPSSITTILNDIDSSLRNFSTPFKIDCDANYFYQYENTVLTTMHNDTIFIKLRIPITVNTFDFKLFKIDIVPVPADADQSIFTIVRYPQPFLLISNDNQTYLSLSRTDADTLIDIGRHRTLLPLKTTQSDCLLNIYFDNHHLISETCQVDLVHNPQFPPSSIYALQDNAYIIYSPNTSWTVKCPNETHQLFHKGLFTVYLHCRCTLLSATARYTATNLQCLQSKHIVKYSVNWFVYDVLYQSIPLNLHPTDFHHFPVKFQLPNFLVNKTKLRTFEKTDLGIKNAISTLNFTEVSVDDDFDLLDWFDYPEVYSATSILTYVLACLNIVMMLIIAYLWFKMYAMSKVLATLLLSSKSVDALTFTLPTTLAPTVLPFDINLILPQIQTTLLLIMVFILSAIFGKLWLDYYYKRNNPHLKQVNRYVRFRLTLTISSLFDQVSINLLDIPVTMKAPCLNFGIAQFSLQGSFLQPRLKIQWSEFSIINDFYEMSSVTTLKLSPFQYFKLRNILSSRHCVHLLATFHTNIQSLFSWQSPPSKDLMSVCPTPPPLYPPLDIPQSAPPPPHIPPATQVIMTCE